MNLYDLIAVTAIRQLLRSGITEDRIRQTLHTPPSFRCDDFPKDDPIFLSRGAIHGQKLSRFLEIVDADVTIVARLPLAGKATIEIIPNRLLVSNDYAGEILAGVECNAISDFIKTNIALLNISPPTTK
ncbi:MAG: hypothetical protein ACLQPD_06465 [Desulfomonilaceae bacterium]